MTVLSERLGRERSALMAQDRKEGFWPVSPEQRVRVNYLLHECGLDKVTAQMLTRWGDPETPHDGKLEENGFTICMRLKGAGETLNGLLFELFREDGVPVVKITEIGWAHGEPYRGIEFPEPDVRIVSNKTWGDDVIVVSDGDSNRRIIVITANGNAHFTPREAVGENYL